MLFQIIITSLLVILALNALYLFVFSAAGLVVGQKDVLEDSFINKKRMLVLIPGYKEDAVIMSSVQSVMAQQYPKELFKCVVLADAFQSSTIENIKQAGAEVLELPEDENRNKAKSIQKFLAGCYESYDACIVLDADNCIDKSMLQKANNYLMSGARIIQAKRVAKNENNSMSRLDALSEIINNHIFRKGQRALGFSASLIGSGMIMEMNLFRMVMEDMNVFSGFDKEMELRILKNKLTIEYAEDILVYDEKVSRHEVYVNQRRRWTYAQLYFLKKNLVNAFVQLISKGNGDYFNKVVQFALMPRIMCLGLSLILIPVAAFAGSAYLITSMLIAALIISALFLAVKSEIKIAELFTLSKNLPAAFTGMVKAIFTSQQASKKFIHTPHNIN